MFNFFKKKKAEPKNSEPEIPDTKIENDEDVKFMPIGELSKQARWKRRRDDEKK